MRGWQTNSEPGRQQQALLHYGGPSRLCYFNLALKGADAPTRVNAAVLGKKKIVPMTVQLERSAQLEGVFSFFFFVLFPPPSREACGRKGLRASRITNKRRNIIGYGLQTVAGGNIRRKSRLFLVEMRVVCYTGLKSVEEMV